jgi:hypothetical protein
MQLLDEYFKLQSEIYDYFGYVEDWVVIPIDDRREYYWSIEGEETDGQVYFTKSKENHEALVANNYDWDQDGVDGNDVYSDEIYTQRHLPKWVYRGSEYTMICIDTHTDGNKFLAIYDNTKEIK